MHSQRKVIGMPITFFIAINRIMQIRKKLKNPTVFLIKVKTNGEILTFLPYFIILLAIDVFKLKVKKNGEFPLQIKKL